MTDINGNGSSNNSDHNDDISVNIGVNNILRNDNSNNDNSLGGKADNSNGNIDDDSDDGSDDFIKGLQWTGTSDPDEKRRIMNDILREKYRVELTSGILSDMTDIERERAQLLLDRSAKKKDKRAEYYKKVREEKAKTVLNL